MLLTKLKKMNSSKKISQTNPKLSEMIKVSKTPALDHPELVSAQNRERLEMEREKKLGAMERDKNQNIVVVEDDDELEEEERNLGDFYEVAPEKLEIEYPKEGGNQLTF